MMVLLGRLLVPIILLLKNVFGSRIAAIIGTSLFTIYGGAEVIGAVQRVTENGPVSRQVEKAVAQDKTPLIIGAGLGLLFLFIFSSRR